MSLKVYIGGKLYDKADAKISVYDHGLLYGDGIFEGIRSYAGRAFRLADHIDRLYDSARSIHLEIPISKEEMTRAVVDTLSINGIKDGYVRLIVTRGAGSLGLDPRKDDRPADHRDRRLDQPLPGRALRTRIENRHRRHDAQPPGRGASPRVKSLNYLNSILAKIEGTNAGCLEALMLNHKGEVAECTGDNIFLVRSRRAAYALGRRRHPRRDRPDDAVMELARGGGIKVVERTMDRHDIYTADECFLTGTAAEVIPVVECDGRPIGTGKPGPITKDLLTRFHKLVREE